MKTDWVQIITFIYLMMVGLGTGLNVIGKQGMSKPAFLAHVFSFISLVVMAGRIYGVW
jgi:xanthine/uracil permease